MAKEGRKSRRKLLEAARKHQDALQGAGLSAAVIEKYENAIKGVEAGDGFATASPSTLESMALWIRTASFVGSPSLLYV